MEVARVELSQWAARPPSWIGLSPTDGAAASVRRILNKPGRRNLAEAKPDNGERFCFAPEPEAKH